MALDSPALEDPARRGSSALLSRVAKVADLAVILLNLHVLPLNDGTKIARQFLGQRLAVIVDCGVFSALAFFEDRVIAQPSYGLFDI